MAVVVDTCGWIEWLTEGQLIEAYAPYFSHIEEIIIPTLVQFELYKWVCREASETRALEVIGLTEQGRVSPLSTSIALLAADLAAAHKLSFGNAIIYATARHSGEILVTSDNHLEGLDGVEYFFKKG